MGQDLKIVLSADASSLFGVLAQAQSRLQNFGVQGAQSVAQVAQGTQRTRAGMQNLATQGAQAMGQISSGAVAVQGHVDGMTGSVFRAGLALGGVRVAFRLVVDLAREAGDATLAMQRAIRMLEYATGDGAAAMAFVRRISQELGLDLQTTAQAYGQLASAARGTRMEGEPTRQLFRAIGSAATTMGLSAEETGGMVIALGQMMSKGKVSAEELRRQLGERLPGAFGIAARAMGVTTAQLDKMLSEGKLLAEDFLPRFAVELQRTLGDAPAKAAHGAQASINRLKTAWTDVLVAFGTGALDEATTGAQAIAEALQQIVADGTARQMGRDLGDILSKATRVAQMAWELRDAIAALAKGYITIKALNFAEHLRQQIAVKVQAVAAALAAREATITEAMALAGHTRILQADIQSQFQAAQMCLVYRSATLAGAAATGTATAAELAAERQAISLAAAKLAEAEAIAAASSASRTGSMALAALGGPMGALVLAIGAGVAAWSYFRRETKSAAQEALEATEKAAQSRSKFVDLQQEAIRLGEAMRLAKAGSEGKKQATEQLQSVIKQMILIYPELEQCIRKEGDAYVYSREEAKRDTQTKVENTKAAVQQAEATLRAALAVAAYHETMAQQAWTTRMPGREGIAVAVGEAAAQRSLAERARADAETRKKNLQATVEELQKWQATLERISSSFTAPASGAKGKAVESHWEEELNRLRREGLRTQLDQTLEARKAQEIKKAELELEAEQLKLKDRAKKEKWTAAQLDQALEEAKRIERKAREEAEANYAKDRLRLEEEVQSKLQAQEEGGLARRQEAIRKAFEDLRQKNSLLPDRDPAKLSVGQIQGAEDSALARARVEQVKQDLGRLKQELAELSQIKGRALSLQEEAEVLTRFAASSDTAAEAVGKLTAELHRNGGAQAGLLSGLQGFVVQSSNQFEAFQNAGASAAQGTQNSFANAFQGIWRHGQTAGQKLDGLWQGVTNSVMGAGSQIVAQRLVAWGLEKAIDAWESIRAGKAAARTTAEIVGEGAKAKAVVGAEAAKRASVAIGVPLAVKATLAYTTAAAAATAAAMTLAAAESWAAYAAIPFGGAGLALAQIAEMEASMVAVMATAKGVAVGTAFATGGVIDKPTWALMGEAGRELVVPEVTFAKWAQNLTRNLVFQERQTQNYSLQSAGYAQSASAQRERNIAAGLPGMAAGMSFDLRGAMFLGSEAETRRVFADMVRQANRDNGRHA